MGGITGKSKASMWKQVFDVVGDNWPSFQMDQERKTPLVSRTFYGKQTAKKLLPDLMVQFLDLVVSPCASHFVRPFVPTCLPLMSRLYCQVAQIGEAERADRSQNYKDGDEKSPYVPLPGKLKVPPPL